MLKSGERRSYGEVVAPRAFFKWAKIASVKQGRAHTYGASVFKDHSHVTEGIVTHNTGRGSATAPAFQCVAGDTEIITPTGIKTAEELIDPLIPADSYNPYRAHTILIAGSKGWQYTSNVFRSWRADLLCIKINNGNELKCTPEHPIMTRDGWVAAKDITRDHYLPVPSKIERRKADAFLTPGVAEVLGLFTAVGTLAMTAPRVYMELPAKFGEWVQTTLKADLAGNFDLEYPDADIAVVSFDLKEDHLHLVRFALALPDSEGCALSPAIRGTDRFYDYMRGMIRAKGSFICNKSAGITLRVPRRDLALALLRETAMDGDITPYIRTENRSYVVRWQGYSAARLLKNSGVHDPGPRWMQPPKTKLEWDNHKSLQVVDIQEAGAGWVYDFTVPKTHSFIANGMLVHNTVPKHSYWGKRLRECIVAPDGHVIVARDYSQGELKVAACWAGEQQMIKAYQAGIDLHTLTAATVNSMSYEEALFLKNNDTAAYEALRQRGKAGNFGLLYGMSAYGFMMYADAVYGVKLTLEEAEAMRNAYFDLYPGLPMWHMKQIMEAQQTGMVRSPLGRVRRLHTINSPIKKVREGAQNQAINSPIQGTLVDLLWMTMGLVEEQKPSLLTPFAQIHDEGLWYVPEDQADFANAYVKEVMENLPLKEKFGWEPELQFTSEGTMGYNLADLKKVT